LPQFFTQIEALLRDVVLIGALGAENATELFILLPMTGEEGAAIVKERIIKKVSECTFITGNRRVGITAKVSVTLPDDSTTDLKSYLAQVRRNHK
jgi:GGDEF domain-containing protein